MICNIIIQFQLVLGPLLLDRRISPSFAKIRTHMVSAATRAVSEMASQEIISGRGRKGGEGGRAFAQFSFRPFDPSLLILAESSHLVFHLFLLKKVNDTSGTCNVHIPTTVT